MTDRLIAPCPTPRFVSRFLAASVLAGSVLLAAPAFAANHPERQWLVKDSAHFSMHYYPGEEKTAMRILRDAEEAYPKLARDFGAKLDHRIPIILTQDSFYNGEAEPVKDRITLDPVLANSSVVGTQRFVAHELAHVMTFAAVDKGNKLAALNSIGGFPTWFLEGIAQYTAEYWYPSNDRMLRLETLENQLLTTTERANFRMLGVYAGAAGYNEGYSLCRYIFDTYGHDKIAVLMTSLREGKHTFEQGIESTFGQNMGAIEAGWKQALREGYKNQVKGLQAEVPGATKIVDTYRGEVNVQPKLSPDGKKLAYLTSRYQDSFLYLRGNVMGFLSLYVADADGKNSQMLPVGKGTVNTFAWSQDGQQIVYSRVVGDATGNPSFDLFTYDMKHRTTTRLTTHEMANTMAWRPNSTQVVYVSIKDGLNTIKLVDTRTKKITTVLACKDDTQYVQPAWSPDGYRLAIVEHRPGRMGHLVEVEPLTGKVTRVTQPRDRVDDANPAWTPDGQSLVFSSDRNGMTNLYRYDLKVKALHQLTNTYRGAEMPAITPDGKQVMFTSYRAKGSMIYRMPLGSGPATIGKAYTPEIPLKPLHLPSLSDMQAPLEPELVSSPTSLGGQAIAPQEKGLFDRAGNPKPLDVSLGKDMAKPYQSTMTNDLLMPEMTSDEKGQQVGVAAMYSDILNKQQLGVDVRFGILSQRFSYMLQYINRMSLATWMVSVYDQPQIGLSPDFNGNTHSIYDALYFQRQRGASLGVQTPLGGGRSLFGGFNFGTLTTLSDPREGNYGQLNQGQLNTLSFGYNEQNIAHTVDADINPSDGYRVNASYTLSDGAFGSHYNFSQYLLQGERYFSIVPDQRQNLAWTWNVGMINGVAAQPFMLGGASGANPIYTLRGYSVGAFTGDRIATTGLEYTVPIFTHMDRMFGPLYMDRLYVTGFTDVGSAWNAGDPAHPYASVGGEVRLKASIMGQQGLVLHLGLAQKLGGSDGPGFYITF